MSPAASRVGVVDSGICNLGSICHALQQAGGDVGVIASPSDMEQYSHVVLPGVGSFPAGMDALTARGLDAAIQQFAAKGGLLLGICLGMQLLFETGHEFETRKGLGLIPGQVRQLHAAGLALPHMGWNQLELKRPDALTAGLSDEPFLYFVHSFACEPANAADVVATCTHGESFCALVQRGNVRGLQAHPEKSQQCGRQILRAFLELAP
ncbi:MAG: imidazole glycerol phosphate synthase subunit HisH [Planctomycetes bacterium]|nr:imidazole glycerol phosphate synthase subunit HisH [Planctomycetota bacterium]